MNVGENCTIQLSHLDHHNVILISASLESSQIVCISVLLIFVMMDLSVPMNDATSFNQVNRGYIFLPLTASASKIVFGGCTCIDLWLVIAYR